MNNLYTLEAANLVVTDGGSGSQPGISTAIELQECQLPVLEENFVEHNPGGGAFAIEVRTNINRLQATFNLAGWNKDVMMVLGRTGNPYDKFSLYGLLRERRTGLALQAKAIIWGRLGRVAPTAFSRGALHAHQYAIHSIVHYELYQEQDQGGVADTIYFFDFFTNVAIVGDYDLMRDYRSILGLAAGIDQGTATPTG